MSSLSPLQTQIIVALFFALALSYIPVIGKFLKCFNIITYETIILFDDFLNRPEYHCILDYYTIVSKTIDNVMVALQKKDCVAPVLELIEHYEVIAS
jgi:hypothetical protein